MDSHFAHAHHHDHGPTGQPQQLQQQPRPIQFPSELEAPSRNSSPFHHHRLGSTHDDLSSLAMSAVGLVGGGGHDMFHHHHHHQRSSDPLNGFSNLYRSRVGDPSQAQATQTQPPKNGGFASGAESSASLLMNHQPSPLLSNPAKGITTATTAAAIAPTAQGRRRAQVPQQQQQQQQRGMVVSQDAAAARLQPRPSLGETATDDGHFEMQEQQQLGPLTIIPDPGNMAGMIWGEDGQSSGGLPAHLPVEPSVTRRRAGDATVGDRDVQDGLGKERHGGAGGGGGGHLPMKMVENPPNLAQWRQRLFDLEEMIVLSEEEFETYFPWVDNVYSHRSTQRYKRKPFVTHYWDCRLKGRPPGTAKSNDPNKKKRKRMARERDQCDVKIKITEYSAGAALDHNQLFNDSSSSLRDVVARIQTSGKPFWTIQRVNGNGINGGGGGGEGKPEIHRHTLAKSDEIKKNSVQRWIMAREKDAKKNMKGVKHRQQQPPPVSSSLSRWKATVDAAITTREHAVEIGKGGIKFYAACYCPFSQRVWIALEAKGLQYQYCETDPFQIPKPTHLLEANPRGLVPAIRQGQWACGESSVILEYLEDLDQRVPLHPTEPMLKANCRLWIDFINVKVLPSFHALLAATEDGVEQARGKLQRDLSSLVQAADEVGPYFLGREMCLVDIHLAPFALWVPRLSQRFVFGDWGGIGTEERWNKWLAALEGNPHIRATTSGSRLYMETRDLLVQGCRDHLE